MKSFNYSLFALLGLVLANTTKSELNVDVVGPVTINQSKAYWASSSIKTQGSVAVGSGGNLSLRAGDTIFLQPGFRVEANGLFSAVISASASYDPDGAYGGSTPRVDWFEPNFLAAAPNTFAGPMTVVVSNSAGTLLTNAPVLLTVESADGWLALDDHGTGAAKTLYLTTADDGTVSVYLKTPSVLGATMKVRVVAGGTTWTLDAYAFTLPLLPDADNDGLSDDTERVALGTNGNAAATVSTAPGLVVFNP